MSLEPTDHLPIRFSIHSSIHSTKYLQNISSLAVEGNRGAQFIVWSQSGPVQHHSRVKAGLP